jgi:hypothetical protein
VQGEFEICLADATFVPALLLMVARWEDLDATQYRHSGRHLTQWSANA